MDYLLYHSATVLMNIDTKIHNKGAGKKNEYLGKQTIIHDCLVWLCVSLVSKLPSCVN